MLKKKKIKHKSTVGSETDHVDNSQKLHSEDTTAVTRARVKDSCMEVAPLQRSVLQQRRVLV